MASTSNIKCFGSLSENIDNVVIRRAERLECLRGWYNGNGILAPRACSPHDERPLAQRAVSGVPSPRATTSAERSRFTSPTRVFEGRRVIVSRSGQWHIQWEKAVATSVRLGQIERNCASTLAAAAPLEHKTSQVRISMYPWTLNGSPPKDPDIFPSSWTHFVGPLVAGCQ